MPNYNIESRPQLNEQDFKWKFSPNDPKSRMQQLSRTLERETPKKVEIVYDNVTSLIPETYQIDSNEYSKNSFISSYVSKTEEGYKACVLL